MKTEFFGYTDDVQYDNLHGLNSLKEGLLRLLAVDKHLQRIDMR